MDHLSEEARGTAQKLTVVYQGRPGAFGYRASLELYPGHHDPVGVASFKEGFRVLAGGEADRAVVPIENALAGSVHDVYALMAQHEITIEKELYLPVQLNLLVIPGQPGLESIRKVFSHPKALEQCTSFFEIHPWMAATEFGDTAGAAEYVAQSSDPSCAAIASADAALLYGLETARPSIQDHANNSTRFVALGSNIPFSPAATRASFLLTLPHRPGSLVEVLQVASAKGVNLTKIESLPVHGSPFEYRFYLDVEASPGETERLHEVRSGFESAAKSCRCLGMYTTLRVVS